MPRCPQPIRSRAKKNQESSFSTWIWVRMEHPSDPPAGCGETPKSVFWLKGGNIFLSLSRSAQHMMGRKQATGQLDKSSTYRQKWSFTGCRNTFSSYRWLHSSQTTHQTSSLHVEERVSAQERSCATELHFP